MKCGTSQRCNYSESRDPSPAARPLQVARGRRPAARPDDEGRRSLEIQRKIPYRIVKHVRLALSPRHRTAALRSRHRHLHAAFEPGHSPDAVQLVEACKPNRHPLAIRRAGLDPHARAVNDGPNPFRARNTVKTTGRAACSNSNESAQLPPASVDHQACRTHCSNPLGKEGMLCPWP